MRLLIGLLCIVAFTQPVLSQLRCSSSEYYVVPDGRDYRGTVNTTVDGTPCQKWTSQSPHAHDTVVPNPSLGLGDDNFCRNPFGDTTVGCFTTNPLVAYQQCNIGPPCTPTTVSRQVTITPPDQSTITVGSFVNLGCTPQPCNLFFTTDGTIPLPTSSAYQHGFPLYASSLVRAVAMYADTSVVYATSQIYVQAVPTSAFLFPSPGFYTTPVLVAVQNAGGQVVQMVAPVTNPIFTYMGPFWLSQTGTVSVIINNTVVISGTYTFRIPTPPPPTVFPLSGVFLGSVRILVYPLPNLDFLEYSLNGSTAMTILTDSIVVVNTIGNATLKLRAHFLSGLVSESTYQYSILPVVPATCTPLPGMYQQPINITCVDPRGSGALLSTTQGSASSAYLSTPGTYMFTTTFSDDSGTQINGSVVYQLVATSLPSPTVQPCGGEFILPGVIVHAVTARGYVTPFVSMGAAVSQGTMDGDFVLRSAATAPVTVVGGFFAQNMSDPMSSSSLPTTCTYVFFPQGTLTTPWYRLQANGVDTTTIAKCVLLVDASLVIQQTYLPFRIVRIAGLATPNLVTTYNNRLATCLQMFDPSIASEGNFSLISFFSFQPNVSTACQPSLTSASVSGFMISQSQLKLVRSEFPCNDIGYQVAAATSTLVPTPCIAGMYRVCAVTDGVTYPVLGNMLLVTSPMTSPASVVPCGGIVGNAPIVVSINAVDGTVASVNGGQWLSVPSISISTPTIVTAMNGDAVQTCVFRPSALLPLKATYQFSCNNSTGCSFSAAGQFSNTSMFSFSVLSPNCSNGVALFSSRTMLFNTTLVLDDAWVVDQSVVPSVLSVCVTDGSQVQELAASGLRFTADTMKLVANCVGCASSYCYVNGSCACIANGTTVPCPLPVVPTASSGTSALTILRAILLIVYVTVLIVVTYIMRREHQKKNKK